MNTFDAALPTAIQLGYLMTMDEDGTEIAQIILSFVGVDDDSESFVLPTTQLRELIDGLTELAEHCGL